MAKIRTPESIGTCFRNRRRDLGLTQQEVSRSARLSLPTVRKLETGGHVTSTTRRAISTSLGWPEDAYSKLAAGAPPAELDQVGQPGPEPLCVADGLEIISEVLFKMGFQPIDTEVITAAIEGIAERSRRRT